MLVNTINATTNYSNIITKPRFLASLWKMTINMSTGRVVLTLNAMLISATEIFSFKTSRQDDSYFTSVNLLLTDIKHQKPKNVANT